MYFKYYYIFLVSGNLSCMYLVMFGVGMYFMVYNFDIMIDEISMYRFFCYVSLCNGQKMFIVQNLMFCWIYIFFVLYFVKVIISGNDQVYFIYYFKIC